MDAASLRVPWQPLDLAPSIDRLIEQANKRREMDRADENAATQRQFAEQNARIQSAREYRDQREYEHRIEEEKKRDIERRAAALPSLFAAARHFGPEAATEMGAPYDVGFNQEQRQASPLMQGEEGPLEAWQPGRAVDPSAGPVGPSLYAAAANMHAPPPQEVGSPDVSPTAQMPEPYSPLHGTGVTVPEEPPAPAAPTPQAEEAPPVAPVQTSGQFHTAEGQGFDAPIGLKLFANVNGHRFAVPEQSQSLGLGGKADEEYQALISAGVPEIEARKSAIATHLDEIKEQGRADRLATAITGRQDYGDTHTYTVEQKQAQFDEAQKQAMERAKVAARSRVQAAGAAPPPAALGDVLDAVERGDSPGDVARLANKEHVSTKVYAPQAQNVVRNATAGERAGQKREALVATDDTGAVIGNWRDAGAAKIGTAQIEAYHRVRERMQALIDDIRTNGNRVTDAAGQFRRQSLAEEAVAALRPFNQLGSTDASVKMERAIVGPTGAIGHGWVWGAQPGVIEHLAQEAEGQFRTQLNTKLRPGGGSSLAPALGGPKAKKKSSLDSIEEWADSLGK